MRPVLLDVDGVLVHGYHHNPALRRCWDEHLEADFGISREVFTSRFIKGVFLDEVLTGRKGLVPALETVLPELGFTGSPLELVAYWVSRDVQLNIPLLEMVKRLRARGVPLYIATNQEPTRAFYLWHVLGLNRLFDDLFYSARLGVCKPDRGFFEAVARRLPDGETPLMFDDTPDVVAAAQAFGWDAVRFDTVADFAHHPWIQECLTS